MQPLLTASFAGRTAEGVRFTFEAGWQCRVFVLANDLVRVLFIPPAGLREPRTWMIAPNGTDVLWEGRDRFDVSAFQRPAFELDASAREVMIRTAALRIT